MIYCRAFTDPLDVSKKYEFEGADGSTAIELAPDGWDCHADEVVVWVDGVEAKGDKLGQRLWGEHFLQFALVPSGAAVAIQIFIAIASAMIAKSMMPDIEAPPSDESSTYGFRGFSNDYVDGGPIPLVYGEHRVAPPVIAQSIDPAWSAWTLSHQERIKMLLAVSDGPIDGFGDIPGEVTSDADLVALPAITDPTKNKTAAVRVGLKVNGQDAVNFEDVSVNWRTGALTQDPPSGWEDTSVDINIDQDLAEVASIDATTKPPGAYTAGNEITAPAGDFAGHSMTDPADSAKVVLDFPDGLYKQDSTGGLVNSTASFRFQYWPVDSGGTQTGDALVLPEWHFTDNTRTHQVVSVPIEFFESTGYQAPIPLGFCACDAAGGDYVEIGPTVVTTAFPDFFYDASKLEFTFAAWVRPHDVFDNDVAILMNSRAGSALTATRDTFPFCPEGPGSGHKGMRISIEFSEDAPGSPQDTFHIVLHGWESTLKSSWVSPKITPWGAEIGVDAWHHVGVTWDGPNSIPVFYWNGEPLSGFTLFDYGTVPPRRPTFHISGPLSFGYHSGTGLAAIPSIVDLADVKLFNGVRPEAIFSAQHTDNYGHTTTGVSADEEGLRTASHFDVEIASGKIENLGFVGVTTSATVFETTGSPLNATPDTDGAVHTEEVGVRLKGRYRVEGFRSNPVLDDFTDEVNGGRWKTLKLIEDDDFERPGLATMTVSILADDQVSNTRPTVSVIARGRYVRAWDGLSVAFPTFATAWSNNPAWIALDLLTSEESGLGAIYKIGSNLDLAAFGAWADYCDEGVEDAAGTPNFWGAAFAASSGDHPNGTVSFKIGLIDNLGAATGESIPSTWKVGHTLRILTCTDADYVTTSDDSIRLEIYDLAYNSDDAAPDGYEFWLEVSLDWTSVLTLPATSGAAVTGTAVGFEARHEFDGVFDSKDANGWDEIMVVFDNARAHPVRFGDTLSVSIDNVRSPVALFSPANIIEGSFSQAWTGIDDRPNAIEIEYHDREYDWEREMLSQTHPSVAGSDDITAERKQRAFMRGVTRRSEVMRQAIYRLNVHHLLRRQVTFDCGIDAIGVLPGDRIRVAHDVPQYGEGGRVYADVSTVTEIKIDRDVIVTFGSTYEIEVRSTTSATTTGAEVRETIALHASMIPGSGSSTLAAGSTITLAAPGFQTFVPDQGDVYSFGVTNSTAEDFTVLEIRADSQTLIRTVSAIEYNADVYLDNAWGDLSTNPTGGLPGPAIPGAFGGPKPPGQDFGTAGTATETSIRGAGGKPRAAVIVTFPATQEASSGGGTNIWAADLSNGVVPTPKLAATAAPGKTSVEIDAKHITEGDTYRFYIQRLSTDRSGRPPYACPYVDLKVSGNVPIPTAPTVDTPDTRGSDAIYGVTFPSGQTPEGVETRVGGWILGQKVATSLRDGELTSDQWVRGTDNAAGDGPLTNYVRTLLPNGQVSHTAEFTISTTTPIGGSVNFERAEEDVFPVFPSIPNPSPFDGLKTEFVTGGDLIFDPADAQLIGKYEGQNIDTGEAKRYYVEAAVQAHQDDGETIGSLGGTVGGRENWNRTFEGATGGTTSRLSHLEILWAPSTTGTAATTFIPFRPGEAYFRSTMFQLRITRPNLTYDCRVQRFSIRIIELPQYDADLTSKADVIDAFQGRKQTLQTTTASYADLTTWATPEIEDAAYTLNTTTGVLTFNETGTYCITCSMSGVLNASGRSELNFEMQEDTGSGFGTVTGAYDANYVARASGSQDEGGVRIPSFIRTFVATDEIKFRIRHVTTAMRMRGWLSVMKIG